jgi:hypothetical protein
MDDTARVKPRSEHGAAPVWVHAPMARDNDRNDLVEQQGVNAGSVDADRDRRPSGTIPVPAATGEPVREGQEAVDGEMVGAPGQVAGIPGQQMQEGEG